MRLISLVILHCSASDNKDHDSVATIDQWHKERGFLRKRIPANAANKQDKSVGYHYIITQDGAVHPCRDESEIGAHCDGYNSHSIGICLTGLNKFTDEQFSSCKRLVASLCAKHNLELKDIVGHNVLNKNKSCPNFNVEEKILKGLLN